MSKMNLILRVAALSAVAPLLAGLLSCGSGKQLSVVGGQSSDETWGPSALLGGQASTPGETALDSVLLEVEAMATPEGTPKGLLQMLGEVLGEKLASRPPLMQVDEVRDLAISSSEGGSITLAWSYRHCGDYNQDGVVNIMDLTPLAVHFGESADEEGIWPYAIDEVIDGNEDGAITVDDITPLAAGFGCEVFGYFVEGADLVDDEFTEFQTITVTPLLPPDGEGRTIFEQTIEVGKCRFFRVSPVDSAGAEGRPSNLVHYGEQLEPLILGVSPQEGYAGEEVQFAADVAGLAPFEYGWDFGHGADPNACLEESPTVVLRGAGDYAAHLMVWNDYGRDDCDFALTVEEPPPPPEPPEILGVAPLILTVGRTTRLAVLVTGTPPFSYYWSAEGLLSGGVSAEHSPEALAEEKRDFIGQVTVVNAAGSDSFFFTLKAGLPEDFPQIVDVQPREMATDIEDRFYPEVTGAEPLEYRWDFGVWAKPSISYEEQPVVYYRGYGPGDYPVVLEVSNEYGKDVFEFMVSVHMFEWRLNLIDETEDIGRSSATVIDNRKMAAYVREGELYHAEVIFACGPYYDSTGMWHRFVVDFIVRSAAWVSLAEVAGVPMIAYCGDFPYEPEGHYVKVAVGRDASPGQGDWDIYTVAESFRDVDICEVQGRPAVVYAGLKQPPDNLRTLYYAINTEPDGSGEWQEVELRTADADFGSKRLGVFDGRPAIVYSQYDEPLSYLYFAIADSPDGLGNWSSNLIIEYPPLDIPQGCHSLAEVDGRPAVSASYCHRKVGWDYEAEVKYLICDTADGMGEWSEATVYPKRIGGASTILSSLAVIDGKVALAMAAYYEAYGWGLWYFTNESADGLGEWEPKSLAAPTGCSVCSLIELFTYVTPSHGAPMIVYRRDGLRCAIWYTPPW